MKPKTRTARRTRQVPVTIDGRTRLGTQTYTENVPVPPRDWDHIILTAATGAAALFLAACVVWTTASVGGLLAAAVPAPVAYGVAGGFDLAWVICLGLEWVARYEPQRAAAPKKAGWVFLLIAMAAVGVHGWMAGSAAVGIVGAAVSVLAKGAWTVVMGYHKVPLSEPVRDVLAQERAELGLELVLAAHRRQALRVRGQLAAFAAALDAPGKLEVVQEPRPEAGERADGTVRAAVRAAQSTLPDADAAAIAAQLAHAGIDVDEDTVRALTGSDGDVDADPDAPAHQQVSELAPVTLEAAVLEAASTLGVDAKPREIAAHLLAHRRLVVGEPYIRTALSRAAKSAEGDLMRGGYA